MMDTTIRKIGECRIPSPLNMATDICGHEANYTGDQAVVRYRVIEGTGKDLPDLTFEKAGPRRHIFFDPAKTRAAIVTCGGLCPGLNNVIRSVFLELHHRYGVKEVLGIRYGYEGLNLECGQPPIVLTSEIVDRIHEHGGTILGSSRGPQPSDVMIQFLLKHQIDILFCVGGDGTLRGAKELADEIQARNLPISVIGIPKTIDNDVLYVQRTFGLLTAVERARAILDCAHVEAKSALNGVGLVKVMGRHAGFVACGATLASGDVNIVLIPESPFVLDGEKGLLAYLRDRLEKRRHAVIVVAEGAGQDLMTTEGEKDRSGNKKMGDIGLFLKEKIVAFGKQVGLPVDVKYFDPSYYVRSVPANSDDAIFCDQLARGAVHAAMSGRTAMIISFWNGTTMHVPMEMATSGSKQVDLSSNLWVSCLSATGQPNRFG